MAEMTNNRHKYFRWTKQTAFITFMYMVVVPSALGVAGYMTEVSAAQGFKRLRVFGMILTRYCRESGKCVASGGEI
jgi:cytochrome b561